MQLQPLPLSASCIILVRLCDVWNMCCINDLRVHKYWYITDKTIEWWVCCLEKEQADKFKQSSHRIPYSLQNYSHAILLPLYSFFLWVQGSPIASLCNFEWRLLMVRNCVVPISRYFIYLIKMTHLLLLQSSSSKSQSAWSLWVVTIHRLFLVILWWSIDLLGITS